MLVGGHGRSCASGIPQAACHRELPCLCRAITQDQEASFTPKTIPVPTILIVDHDRGFLDMLRRLLVDAGYQVITATHGHAALAEFQAQRPDLVVLEWQLPGLDGIAVIRRIRETDATPILMRLARAAIEYRRTARD